MKKKWMIFMYGLIFATFLCTGETASAETDTTEATVICPLPAATDSEEETELFDLVDVNLMKEGDIIVLQGEEVTVETIEWDKDGSILINGGYGEENGHILVTDEDTVYYEKTADSDTEAGNELPYTIRITRNDLPVFDGPGYDYSYVWTVYSAGTFTIVDEEEDSEGVFWGCLKSGAGWIDLSEAVSEETNEQPVTAVFASGQIVAEGEYLEYVADDSETALAFRPNEELKDVTFSLLEYDEEGEWKIAEERYTIPVLSEGDVFVAGISFYGDMTAYGISFTDEAGEERCFAVHISGRNGSLLLDEYGAD
ncbi:MAG: hypothetical protein LUG56_09930 [Lachnospiraceae bacterium]|nr:hypothetical protein [Lachnospiraceae bacterium]